MSVNMNVGMNYKKYAQHLFIFSKPKLLGEKNNLLRKLSTRTSLTNNYLFPLLILV